MSRPNRGRFPALLALIVLVALVARAVLHPTSSGPAAPSGRSAPAPAPVAGAVESAFRDHRSSVELGFAGRVTQLLADDREGSRHQRFIVRAGERTVLVAYNLDLAPRVPLAVGDSVEILGEYIWSARGGTVHWTHRDPLGQHPAGWVRVNGRVYQ